MDRTHQVMLRGFAQKTSTEHSQSKVKNAKFVSFFAFPKQERERRKKGAERTKGERRK